MHLQPIGPLGAEATGIRLNETLTSEQVRAIEAAMDRYGVLVFRGQPVDEHQQVAFAKCFGDLDIGLRRIRPGAHRFAYNELADISNVDAEGALVERAHAKFVNNVANQLWHCDSSFQRPRAKYSMLAAAVVPAYGGETEFADLRLAHDALPAWRKAQVQALQAVHSALHSRFVLGDSGYTQAQREAFPSVTWPLVQTDARSGRKVLYVGAHACEVVGMTLAEGRMLLMDLIEHAAQRQFVYRHHWQQNDLVMWDNTATMHRGRWFDVAQRRELRRATTLEAVAHADTTFQTNA